MAVSPHPFTQKARPCHPFSFRATIAVYGRAEFHTFYGRRGTQEPMHAEAKHQTTKKELVAGKRMWHGGDSIPGG